MNLTIRRARPDDLGAVAQLLTEAAAWLAELGTDQWQEPVTGRRRDRIAAGIAAGDVWVVDRNGEIVATITIDERADPEFWQPADDPGSALYGHRMVVARSGAGQGIGAALLDFAGQLATAAGRAWLRLDAWSNNTALQDYYRQQGFEHIRTHRYAHRGSGALFQRPSDVRSGGGPTLLEAPAPGRGAGVFVRQRQPARRVASDRYQREVDQIPVSGSGLPVPATSFTLDRGINWADYRLDRTFREVAAPAHVAELLAVAPGTPLLARHFVFYAEDQPEQLSDSYLPLSLVSGTPIADPANEPWPGGNIAQLATLGVVVTRVRESVKARRPTEEEARTLQIPPGVSVFAITRVMFAGPGRDQPVEAAVDIVIPADRTILEYVLDLDPPAGSA